MAEVTKSRYVGKQYIKFAVKDERGEEITNFALRFNRRDGFYYCFGSKRLTGARNMLCARRPTWQDLAAASLYMLGRMHGNQGTEFGPMTSYSIARDQTADLRFSPVIKNKKQEVKLPITIDDTGEILEDSFHLKYTTAMRTMILLMRLPQSGGSMRVEAVG